jgi:hypothetical protein
MGCREKKRRNGIQKNNKLNSSVKKITSVLSIRSYLTSFLFLFVLFASSAFGQNFSDNKNINNHNSLSYETDPHHYGVARRNQNIEKNDSVSESVNSSVNSSRVFLPKRKIQLQSAANQPERPNAFLSQQEEERVNKQNAIKKIPWDELTTPVKQKISSIIQNNSVYYHLPTQAIFCDPEVYQYFLEHPDLLVGFWESLGVTQITLRETETNRYNLIETTGTIADVGMFYRSTNCCVVYAKGEYKNPITNRKIDGETLLILQSRYARNAENEPIVVCKLDVFIKIDNIGADLLAKLFSTSLGKIADGNFEQTLGFVSHVSDTSAISANAVKRLTKSVKNVREEVRNDFTDVIDRVSLRAARRVEKRLINYHRENGNLDEYHLGQNKTISQKSTTPASLQNPPTSLSSLNLQPFDVHPIVETIAQNNESNDSKTEIKNELQQEIFLPDIQSNSTNSTNPSNVSTFNSSQPVSLTSEIQLTIPKTPPKKRAIFTPPKL